MRLEKVLTNFRLAKCRLTVTSKVCFYVVCLKIENDFKASHVEDFQELNNFWYHLGINFSIKENLFGNFENTCTYSSDEFELEFSGSSEPELWSFRVDPSQAGALQFSS